MSKMDIVLHKFLMSEVEEERDKESLQSQRLKSYTNNVKTPKLSHQIGGGGDHQHSRYRAIDAISRKFEEDEEGEGEESPHTGAAAAAFLLRRKSMSMRRIATEGNIPATTKAAKAASKAIIAAEAAK